ncbi:MAG: tetratricopeptide repeat protein, partial [Pirellulales bacterium]
PQAPEKIFELFYGAGALPLLVAVERLCRIAKEAGGRADDFYARVEAERTVDVDTVLRHIKTAPNDSFLRIILSQFDRGSLEREIHHRLLHLVHEKDRQALNDFLFAKFQRGLEARVTFSVRDLMREANERRIEFCTPQAFEAKDLDPVVGAAIFILQECEWGLPAEILAAGVGCSTDQLNEPLSRYIECAMLSRDGDLWSVARFKPALVRANGSALLARALRHLMEFISQNRSSTFGWRQIPNAIALAKACQTDFPEQVACLLWDLNSLLKRAGNKRVVLEVANLSLASANRSPRTEKQARAEAVALICGRSWVYQRTNRLAEARAEAEKSLKLGEEIGWERNTAFCIKCIGRLFRMEAEHAARENQPPGDLLRSSVDYLRRAIDLFPRVSELTAAQRTAEVGDCFSLLGRTYFVAGDYAEARNAAGEAVNRLTDQTSKDYADLQILLGDIASVRNDRAAADSYYGEAIAVCGVRDAEKSEIAARAWFQKGLLASNGGCYDKAAEIWRGLDEPEFADRAKWESMVLTKKVPRSAVDALKGETPSVRIEVLRHYEGQLSQLSASFRGRRSEPDARYW